VREDGVHIGYDYSGLGRSVFFHELGHWFDMRVMTDAARARFAAILHRRYDPTTYWLVGGEDRSLAEWFAEGYRLCSMYRRFRDPVLLHVDVLYYRYEPSARQQRQVCALLRRARISASR
jgi:hypothetical protein